MLKIKEQHLTPSKAKTPLEALTTRVLDVRRMPPLTIPMTPQGPKIAPEWDHLWHKVRQTIQVTDFTCMSTIFIHAQNANCRGCCAGSMQVKLKLPCFVMQRRMWTSLLRLKRHLMMWMFKTLSRENVMTWLHCYSCCQDMLRQQISLVHPLHVLDSPCDVAEFC